MTKVIALANQKGGVGKTTTAINLSAALQNKGKQVLLVDIDPQGNATSGCGIDKKDLASSLYDVLLKDVPIASTILATEQGFALLPAKIDLAGAEIELVSVFSRENRLQKLLQPLMGQYDYILIDCPPSLGLLTINALTAAQSVVIPLQCEFFALEGMTQMLNTLDLVKNNLNEALSLDGLLIKCEPHALDFSHELGEQTSQHI